MIRSRAGSLLLTIVAAALIVAIALPAGAAVVSRTVTVGSAANGKSLELKKGDTLVVRLAANPTTGYDWAIVSKPKALELVKSTFLVPHSNAVGQGGTDVFRFSVRSGQGRLELAYRRSWEKGIAPAHTFRLEIRAS